MKLTASLFRVVVRPALAARPAVAVQRLLPYSHAANHKIGVLHASAFTAQPIRMMSSSTGGGSKAEGGEGAAGGEGEGAEALTGEPVGEQPNTAPEPMKPPPATEKATGPTEEHEFQAETRRLLDIVASSLYSDKEVFVREIVSNSSDALEKMRHRQLTAGFELRNAELPLEIRIWTDPEEGTFTIQDTGIGMSKEEMVTNLGTIAKSGSKAFVAGLDGEGSSEASSASSNIIGQFGVGFYSTFMVGNKVTVYSQSAEPDAGPGHVWESDGTGRYTIGEAEGVERGTKVVIHLNELGKDYADKEIVQDVLEKHSNFVSFPIELNGSRMNNIEAIWTKSPSEVSTEDHSKFYRFVAGAWDSPKFTLHYQTDAPLQMKALLYVPQMESEKFGLGRQEPGVSLYSRKVLILEKAPKLLPDWLRFMKGVVDSEDIPLNLSRELLQDSALIEKIKSILSGRIVRFFRDESRKDEEKYMEFFKDFGNYLREGAVTDQENAQGILKLMRYESSKDEPGNVCSLDEYVARLDEDEDKIYYFIGKDRAMAEESPYMEALLKKGIEVIYSYEPLDDVVFQNVAKYGSKRFVSVETSSVDVGLDDQPVEDAAQVEEMTAWVKETLGEAKVAEVVSSTRLVSHPAIISDQIASGAVRRMMRMLEEDGQEIPPQNFEVNFGHPLLQKLATVKSSDPALAELILEQIYDSAMVYAGLMDDTRPMLTRVAKICEAAIDEKQ